MSWCIISLLPVPFTGVPYDVFHTVDFIIGPTRFRVTRCGPYTFQGDSMWALHVSG